MAEISAPKIREALYDLIERFASPKIDPENIIWGNQNDISLPANSNDYIVFYITDTVRHGTNISQYDPDAEVIDISESNEINVQIDCYCNSNNGTDGSEAMLRAKSLEIVLRDDVGASFLKPYGLSCLYADDARDTTVIGDSALLLKRWTVIGHLQTSFNYKVEQEGFTHAYIKSIKDIDVFYKP